MRPCLLAPTFAVSLLSLLLGPCPAPSGASAGPARWLPTVRLVGWSGVQRVDRWRGGLEGERRLAPIDRGLAVQLGWVIGADAGQASVERDGRMPADPGLDDWIRDAGLAPVPDRADRFVDTSEPTPRATDARSARPPPGPPGSPGGRVDDTGGVHAIRRRAAAVRRAIQAVHAARTPAERRRAALDLREARAVLRVHGGIVDAAGQGASR